MTWFESLTGFPEHSPEQVRENLILKGNAIQSKVKKIQWLYGHLVTPSLKELRERTAKVINGLSGTLQVSEMIF